MGTTTVFVNSSCCCDVFFFFQAEDGIRDLTVTGVQTCALPIFSAAKALTGTVPQLGSKELNFMVEGQPASANDANQPFFFAARLKAAENLPAADRKSVV